MNLQKIIAIDGPSGAGKSSLTKEVAKALGLMHIDSGAIYRTAALLAFDLFQDRPLISNDEKVLIEKLKLSRLSYCPSPTILIEFNGKDVTRDIRMNSVSMMASKVSAFPSIRNWVNEQLHQIVQSSPRICIMEGRDIGSVIFPKAMLKIFLTASSEVRAKRRKLELEQMGKLGNLTLAEIQSEIEVRDHADSTRAIAPLICAQDAIKVDTSNLSFNEVLDKIILLVANVLKS
jgi:cytidylate kinase